MSNPETAALLAHIVSQVESNVQFLVSQNYISPADANAFLAKLPEHGVPQTQTAALPSLTSRMKNLMTSSPAPPPAAPARQPQVQQAKALWAYNEHGQDADDLSFSAGDIIEIVEETNADWWMGKFNGKQALFPSAYVERIASPSSSATASASAPALGRTVAPVASTKTPYRPFGAAHHGRDPPPPAVAGGVNSVGLQQAGGQEEKKSKFGKYGDTMAHSAAGGVGFGAGAAIGGGLVRAIF